MSLWVVSLAVHKEGLRDCPETLLVLQSLFASDGVRSVSSLQHQGTPLPPNYRKHDI